MVVASILWTACGAAGPGPMRTVDPDQAFSLGAGQLVVVSTASLQIGFDGVRADSRCPKGETCIWAGDAIVQLWLQRGAGPRETRELHTMPGGSQSTRVGAHELHLLRLDPYPVTGKPIAKGDYLATLVFRLSPTALPDR